MRIVSISLVCLIFIFGTDGVDEAHAFSSPLGVSLYPVSDSFAIGFPWPKSRVAGIRTGFVSRNLDVYGIDIGLLANITSATFGGIGISGGVNVVGRNAMISGLQLASLINANQGSVAIFGLQIAGLVNSNAGKGHLVGGQFSLIRNYSPQTDIYGVQTALTNSAKTVYGFQIGLINVAGDLKGVQIGILNFNLKARPFGFFPGINIGF